MIQLNKQEMKLVELISEECKSPADVTSKLKNLFAGTLQKILEAEMDEHLGYEKNSISGNNSGNSRNSYGKKTIKSEWGESEIAVPRDRKETFKPQIIQKRQTRTDDIEARILAMYQKGIYSVEASASLISRITDKIMPELNEWQTRPLSEIYPVGFFDGIYYKVRKDGKIINKCV